MKNFRLGFALDVLLAQGSRAFMMERYTGLRYGGY